MKALLMLFVVISAYCPLYAAIDERSFMLNMSDRVYVGSVSHGLKRCSGCGFSEFAITWSYSWQSVHRTANPDVLMLRVQDVAPEVVRIQEGRSYVFYVREAQGFLYLLSLEDVTKSIQVAINQLKQTVSGYEASVRRIRSFASCEAVDPAIIDEAMALAQDGILGQKELDMLSASLTDREVENLIRLMIVNPNETISIRAILDSPVNFELIYHLDLPHLSDLVHLILQTRFPQFNEIPDVIESQIDLERAIAAWSLFMLDRGVKIDCE